MPEGTPTPEPTEVPVATPTIGATGAPESTSIASQGAQGLGTTPVPSGMEAQNPPTGDETDVVSFLLMLILAAMSVAGITYGKRRRNK